MSKKTINDVLEYLYEQKRKDLAAIVIAELRQPVITTTSHLRPQILPNPLKPVGPSPFEKGPWMSATTPAKGSATNEIKELS